MRTAPKTAIVLGILALAAGLAACEALKDTINENASETKTIEVDLTDDWVPLFAIQIDETKINALCYADEMTIDSLVGATDYADVWDSAKGHLDKIEMKSVTYRLNDNVSAGGSLDLFLVNQLPDALPLPGGLDPADYGLDTLTWRLVDPDALSSNDQVVSVPIPDGTDVPDWSDADFVGDGKSQLEDQFLEFEEPFAFCLRLNLPLHGPTSTDPDVNIKLRAVADLTFTPL